MVWISIGVIADAQTYLSEGTSGVFYRQLEPKIRNQDTPIGSWRTWHPGLKGRNERFGWALDGMLNSVGCETNALLTPSGEWLEDIDIHAEEDWRNVWRRTLRKYESQGRVVVFFSLEQA